MKKIQYATLERTEGGELFLRGLCDGEPVEVFPCNRSLWPWPAAFFIEANGDKWELGSLRFPWGVREKEAVRAAWGVAGLKTEELPTACEGVRAGAEGDTRCPIEIAPPVIHNWEIREVVGGGVRIYGQCHGHPCGEPGLIEVLKTSRLKHFPSAHVVETESGSVYSLGVPHRRNSRFSAVHLRHLGCEVAQRQESWRSPSKNDMDGLLLSEVEIEYMRLDLQRREADPGVSVFLKDGGGRTWECLPVEVDGELDIGYLRPSPEYARQTPFVDASIVQATAKNRFARHVPLIEEAQERPETALAQGF